MSEQTCATHGHLYGMSGRCLFCPAVREAVQPPATPQEPDVHKELAVLTLRAKSAERAYDRLNLCSDHRDKATGRCIVCDGEERSRRASTPSPEGQTCEWRWDDDSDVWRSSCPTENYGPEDAKHDTPTMGWKVCPYCGAPLKVEKL